MAMPETGKQFAPPRKQRVGNLDFLTWRVLGTSNPDESFWGNDSEIVVGETILQEVSAVDPSTGESSIQKYDISKYKDLTAGEIVRYHTNQRQTILTAAVDPESNEREHVLSCPSCLVFYREQWGHDFLQD